ncbi:hypothetical protein RvY_00458 [Ramazzottius varieornatus]|uniref:Uncharacterized protein n=1 Tax=Ramazzottius varieornatus TaxID=947166 RepID=A0A1D1UJ54_RAMVA|nr:hypothetical protein RvY_00458 [Ramazzottius varieornatus]
MTSALETIPLNESSFPGTAELQYLAFCNQQHAKMPTDSAAAVDW